MQWNFEHVRRMTEEISQDDLFNPSMLSVVWILFGIRLKSGIPITDYSRAVIDERLPERLQTGAAHSDPAESSTYAIEGICIGGRHKRQLGESWKIVQVAPSKSCFE